MDHYAGFNWLRNFTPKPMSNTEAVASSAVKAAIDMNASLMAVVTNCLPAVRMLAKYRCDAWSFQRPHCRQLHP